VRQQIQWLAHIFNGAQKSKLTKDSPSECRHSRVIGGHKGACRPAPRARLVTWPTHRVTI
jgi:hypothetical protein